MGASVFLMSLAPEFGNFRLRRAFLLVTGVAFPVVFLLMVQPELASWGGLLQRLLDIAMAISLALVLWTLAPTDRNAQRAAV